MIDWVRRMVAAHKMRQAKVSQISAGTCSGARGGGGR